MHEYIRKRLGNYSETFVKEYCERFNIEWLVETGDCLKRAGRDMMVDSRGKHLMEAGKKILTQRRMDFVDAVARHYGIAAGNLPDILFCDDHDKRYEDFANMARAAGKMMSTNDHIVYMINLGELIRIVREKEHVFKAIRQSFEGQQLLH